MLYIPVLTLGDIRKGIESVSNVARRQILINWLHAVLLAFFTGRIMPVNHAVADRWGQMSAAVERPLPVIDSLLAAIALQHVLVLVTRNTKSFKELQVSLFNPWEQ